MLVELREVAQFGQRAAFGTLRPGVQIPPSRLVKLLVRMVIGLHHLALSGKCWGCKIIFLVRDQMVTTAYRLVLSFRK